MKEVAFWGLKPPASAMIRLAAAREGVHLALSLADNGAASLAPLALAAHTVPVAVESMRVASDHAEAAVCDLPASEIGRGGGMHTSGEGGSQWMLDCDSGPGAHPACSSTDVNHSSP